MGKFFEGFALQARECKDRDLVAGAAFMRGDLLREGGGQIGSNKVSRVDNPAGKRWHVQSKDESRQDRSCQ